MIEPTRGITIPNAIAIPLVCTGVSHSAELSFGVQEPVARRTSQAWEIKGFTVALATFKNLALGTEDSLDSVVWE